MAGMRESGMEVDDKASYDTMKDFVERDQYSMEMDQNGHLWIMLHMAATILDLLPLRHWSLIVAAQDAGQFICTDNPVLLTWTEKMPPFFSPGFGVGSTEINVPRAKSTLPSRVRIE